MADYNSSYTGAQIDSAIGALSTALQPSDISAFESTTQLNNRDTANRTRSNHTGTQLASTISDFDSAVNNLALDSATVLGLIDSAHVQLSAIGLPYTSLTGSPNVLDSADVSLIAGSSAGVDSATVLGLIDSDHVQLRQDYAYGSLSGAPTALSAFINDTLFLDSDTATQLIDSAYVQLRQSSVGSGGGLDSALTTQLIDSDYIQLRQSGGGAGVDSAYVTAQIDALIDGAPGALDTLNELAAAINDDSQAYNTLLSLVNTKIDSADAITLISTTVDSAYVQLRQSSVGSSTFAGLTEIALADLDVHDIAVPATSVHVITPNGSSAYRSDIHGTTDNPTLYVSAGETIAFDLTGVTGSHPFEIRSDASTAYNTGLIHIAPDGTRTTGSSAQGKTSGTLYWKVPGSINGTYKYRCTNHSGMIGDIIIGDPSADLDSAAVIGLIDSDYIQLRQDYAYGSLTGTPNVLDSADVSSIAGSLSGLDAAAVTALVDSDYVQLRQDYAYASLTGAPNVLDSADVSSIAGSAGLDSALSIQLIDSKIQVLDIADIVGSSGNSGQYLKSLGSGDAEWANVLDSAGVATIAGGLSGLDSGGVSALVDSAYVQLSAIGLPYSSLTATPNILDSADVSLIAGDAGTDSATVLGLIDSAHVQLRQDYAYASLTGAPSGGLDSALSQTLIDATVQVLDISDIVGAEGTSGQYLKSLGSGNAGWESFPTILDSALTTQLIDSAYVQLSAIGLPYSSLTATPNLIDSALTTQLIDSAYVQLRSGGGGLSAWVEKTDAYTLVAGDRIVLDTRDSALSLTLPASPTFSDEVSIMDGTNYAATNNVTVSGNGKKILASDSDFVINIDRASIDLMFYNDSQGWILTKTI
jgi:plastocyanin